MGKTITLSPSGKVIPCEDGQTVLAALEKQGLVLPNNCRAGACGECKTKVLKGKFDQGFILDMALSQTDRQNGMGLMCMAKLIDDNIEIEFETRDKFSKLHPPKENIHFIVTEKIQATESIVKIRIRPLESPVRFWPGQYVSIGESSKQIPYRKYSIANYPNPDGELVFFISKIKNGITSRWIHDQLQVGDALKINGPYGTFIGNPQSELPVLCLASGSGLAPIMSLSCAALLRGGFRYPATVIFSAKTRKDILEPGLFRFLEAKFKNFKFIPTLTQEKNEHIKHGRIPDILASLYPHLNYYDVYIAGNPEFVEDCKKKALELGAKPEQIYLESFL